MGNRPDSSPAEAAPAPAPAPPAPPEEYDELDPSAQLRDGLGAIGAGFVQAGAAAGALAASGAGAAADASLRAAAELVRASQPQLRRAGRATRAGAGQARRLAQRAVADVELGARVAAMTAARLAMSAAARVDALSFGVGLGAAALVWLLRGRGERHGARGGSGVAGAAEDDAGSVDALAASGEDVSTAAAAVAAAAADAAAAAGLSDDADDAAAVARGRVHAHVLRALVGHVAALERAGRAEDARALFTSLEWQMVLLDAGGLTLLIRDLTRRSVNDRGLALLAALLRRCAPALRRERAAEALPAQLLGRLGRTGGPALPADVAALLREASAWRAVAPWLRPLQPSLDAPGGPLEVSLEGHNDAVTAVALLPHAGRVATGSRDASVRVWDPALAACVAVLDGHAGGVTSLAALPDGTLVSGSLDGTLRCWGGPTAGGGGGHAPHAPPPPPAVCVRVLTAGKHVYALAVVAGGRVAVGADSPDVALWDVGRGGVDGARLRGHADRVTALAALANGTRLATASADGELRLWHLHRRACLALVPAGKVTALAALGRCRVAAANIEGVRVWDLEAAAAESDEDGMSARAPELALSSGKVNALCGLGDARVVTGSDHMVRTWAVGADASAPTSSGSNGALGACVRALKGRRCATTALAELPDGRIVSGGADGVTRIWAALDAPSGAGAPVAHDNRVTALAALPGGRVASASWDCTLRLWSADGRCERVLSGHNARVNCLVATDDGHVVSAADAALRVWAAADGGARRTMEGAHARAVACLAALPHGRVASGGEDGIVKVWGAASGQLLHTLAGHEERVTALCGVAGSATLLLSGSADRTARVWCTRAGACLATLRGHTEGVTAVAALPRSGGLLATGGDDKAVCVWAPEAAPAAADPESDANGGANGGAAPAWRLVATLRGHSDAVRSLVALDGERVASVGARDTLRVWNVVTRLCETQGRAGCAALLPANAGAAPSKSGGGGGGAAAAEAPPLVLGCRSHVGGTFGAVPCYVDDAVRVLLVVPPAGGEAEDKHDKQDKDKARATVVVAATDAGAVHFLQLCAPPLPR